MAPSIAQLQALTELARCGSFTQAARRLRITQSAVTQHVANLAKHFKIPLVDVIHRRPVLTEAGRYLAERAMPIVRSVTLLEQEMDEFVSVRNGVLLIGATQTIGTYLLPSLLSRYAQAFPGIRAEVHIANTARISEMIRTGDINVALIEGAVAADLVGAPFEEDELVVAAARSDRRFGRSRLVTAQDLKCVPFVSRESGSGTRDFGYDALTRIGVEPPIALILPSGEAILQAVVAGLGVAILSRFVLQKRADDIRILRIADLPMRRMFSVVAAPERTLSPAQRAFVHLLLHRPQEFAAFESALARKGIRSAHTA